MREIKFRAWNKLFKRMSLVKRIDFQRNNRYTIYTKNSGGTSPTTFELMQFTGLKDKNEKEIYEGDIVISKGDPDVYFLVGFGNNDEDDSFGFNLKALRFSKRIYTFVKSIQKMKVIGNKFENPELLK